MRPTPSIRRNSGRLSSNQRVFDQRGERRARMGSSGSPLSAKDERHLMDAGIINYEGGALRQGAPVPSTCSESARKRRNTWPACPAGAPAGSAQPAAVRRPRTMGGIHKPPQTPRMVERAKKSPGVAKKAIAGYDLQGARAPGGGGRASATCRAPRYRWTARSHSSTAAAAPRSPRAARIWNRIRSRRIPP